MIEKVKIPEGKSGDWEVKYFTITEEESHFSYLQLGGRGCRPGKYTKLCFKGACIMSDTPAEMRDHSGFVREATGKVLIAGLGIGMVAVAVANKPDVTEVVVVEIDPDVIKLTAPHLNNPKIKVIQSDIHEFKTDQKFDHGWFDIWGDISTDDLVEMKALQMKFRRWIKKSDCWGKALLLAEKKRHDNDPWERFRRMKHSIS